MMRGMGRWMLAVCCVGVLVSGCGAREVPQAVTCVPRVACVGDSITQGFGGYSYVALLAEDTDMVVGNFGVCGATAMAQVGASYRASGAYAESLDWDADVVVLMLGTNDTGVWQGREAFATDYESLVAAYLAQGAKVALATPLAPSAAVNGYGIVPAHYDDVCAVIAEIAAAHQLPLVDVYAASEGKDVTLDDGIHPNATGAQLIADMVSECLHNEGWV